MAPLFYSPPAPDPTPPSTSSLSSSLPLTSPGSLSCELAAFSMLRSIYLGINSLSETVPLELEYASSLSEIDLSENLLGGVLPPSVRNLCDRLVSLGFHGNSLSGSLPEPALPNSTCRSSHVLDFGGNRFSGEFPEFVTSFEGPKQLDLSSNLLSGPIPQSLDALRLDKLNLSNNNFTGELPSFLGAKYGVDAFEGNTSGQCGLPLQSCEGNSEMSRRDREISHWADDGVERH